MEFKGKIECDGGAAVLGRGREMIRQTILHIIIWRGGVGLKIRISEK